MVHLLLARRDNVPEIFSKVQNLEDFINIPYKHAPFLRASIIRELIYLQTGEYFGVDFDWDVITLIASYGVFYKYDYETFLSMYYNLVDKEILC